MFNPDTDTIAYFYGTKNGYFWCVSERKLHQKLVINEDDYFINTLRAMYLCLSKLKELGITGIYVHHRCRKLKNWLSGRSNIKNKRFEAWKKVASLAQEYNFIHDIRFKSQDVDPRIR